MKKILLIDNDPRILELTKARLEANQYEVTLASDGEEGFAKAQSEKPNLIIVDIKMPKVDGYTFIRKLKREDDLKDTPVIILTAYVHMQDLFTPEGVEDYLVKPFNADELLKKIRQHLV